MENQDEEVPDTRSKLQQEEARQYESSYILTSWISTNKICIPNRENRITKAEFRLKTFFVVMFFAILNFEILFLVFSFFMNLHFSSAQVPRDEKYKFTKNENTENKISKFRIAKNITTKNVFRMCFYNFIFPMQISKAYIKRKKKTVKNKFKQLSIQQYFSTLNL